MDFLRIMLLYPIIVIVASIIGYLFFRKWYVAPALTMIVFTFFTFTLFNESFFIWGVIYTIISLVTSLFMKLVKT